MVFRIRRYRLFLGISLVIIATIYHLAHFNTWEVPDIDRLKNLGVKTEAKYNAEDALPRVIATIPPALVLLKSTTSLDDFPISTAFLEDIPPASTSPVELPKLATEQASISPSSTKASLKPTSTTFPVSHPPSDEQLVQVGGNPPHVFDPEILEQGQGRLESGPRPSDEPQAHWKPQQEHFPVAEGDLIPLPTGKAQKLPKIQYIFEQETQAEQSERLQRLGTIKAAFQHAWSGYRTYAMGHDELKPVSGNYSNPFNGWGATLVDSLDTLWIMDLKDEFEEAVEWVKKIDFTTSSRKDIPIFETTIRYLGGLISAYDLTGPGKYPVLLDKAVELANIMMGAFDTPNRMPDTYYYWPPSYASQPHRAKTRVVLAELGSLLVEFTRLAQLTKENKYYDAVARITDALEAWQMKTAMPGLWPLSVDASGCKKADISPLSTIPSLQPHFSTLEDSPVINSPVQDANNKKVTESLNNSPDEVAEAAKIPAKQSPTKRQLDDAETSVNSTNRVWTQQKGDVEPPAADEDVTAIPRLIPSPAEVSIAKADCEPQGLTEEPNARRQTFSIGAQADSTYEYFPKEYLLLGGQVEQYKSMYQEAAKVVRKQLLFRPMTKQELDILFVGSIRHDKNNDGSITQNMIYEGTHLSCFAGGMFALGSKVFGIQGDLDIARKLTDGCIWSYESTTTGIMPEEFTVVPCESRTSCTWNISKWYEVLDPNEKDRIEAMNQWNKNQKFFFDQSVAEAAEAAEAQAAAKKEKVAKVTEIATEDVPLSQQDIHTTSLEDDKAIVPEVLGGEGLQKRQTHYASEFETKGPTHTVDEPDLEEEESTLDAEAPVFTPRKVLSHEAFAESRIKEERLPPGFVSIKSRYYGLRPEAIESVWIMYRITGEDYWRQKGWKMFKAIQTYTLTELGNSMITDVTSEAPLPKDTMESFWLAETLKYCYLLFSEPSRISLDDYVLNTEAHPFKRPK